MSDGFKEIAVDSNSTLIGYWVQRLSGGGYTVYVSGSGSVIIKCESYGTVASEMSLQSVDLNGLINLLTVARDRLEEAKIVDKLRGKKL